MKKIIITGIILIGASTAYAGNITALDFKFSEPNSSLVLETDSSATFEKTVSEADNQVIIDLKGTKVPDKFKRKIDASQFKSNVAIVSAYEKGDDARIVIQLKGPGNVDVNQNSNTITASIANGNSATASVAASSGAAQDTTEAPDLAAPADGTDAPAKASAAASTNSNDNKSEVAAKTGGDSDSSNATGLLDPDGLESFIEAANTKKYVGSKISIQMMNADLQDIFQIIGKASEFNIILAETVKGKMSLDLVDVPWDQVLDIVLKSNKLSAERVSNILRILPTDDLQKEKQAEVQAKRAVEVAEPLVSKIFPISYAVPADVQRILTSYLSKDPGTNLVRGAIDIDARTNSLVIRETPSTIEKFKRIIKELDSQTPQILIESKFVEVKENFARQFVGEIFSTSRKTDNGVFDFHPGNNNYGAIFGTGSLIGSSTSSLALTAATSGASLGFAPKAGLLPGMPNLGALLNISEATSMSKTISSPRVVTQNRKVATITQGITVTFPTAAGANSSGGFQTLNATMSLVVEPQVTNEGSINLHITFTESKPTSGLAGSSLTTSNKSVDTYILADSGSTVVIGGVYSSDVSESEGGIPFLRDIPILGAFFGSKSKSNIKNELFIFLSPRVLNEKEAGLRA